MELVNDLIAVVGTVGADRNDWDRKRLANFARLRAGGHAIFQRIHLLSLLISRSSHTDEGTTL